MADRNKQTINAEAPLSRTSAPASKTPPHVQALHFSSGKVFLYPSYFVFHRLQGHHRRALSTSRGTLFPARNAKIAYGRILRCATATYLVLPNERREVFFRELLDYVTRAGSLEGLEALFFSGIATVQSAHGDSKLLSSASTLWSKLTVPRVAGAGARTVPVLDATRGILRFLNASALSALGPQGANFTVIQNLGKVEFIGQAQAAGMFNGASVMDAEGVCESIVSIGGMVVGAVAGAVTGGLTGGEKFGLLGGVAGGVAAGIAGAVGGGALGDRAGGAICGWAIGETGTKVEHGQQGGSDAHDDFSSFGSDDIQFETGDAGAGSDAGTGSAPSGTDASGGDASGGDASGGDDGGGDDGGGDDGGVPNPDDPDGFPNPEDPRGLQISGQSRAQGDFESYMKFNAGAIQFTNVPQLAADGLSVATPGFLAGSPILQQVAAGKAAIVKLAWTPLTPSIRKTPVAKGKVQISAQR